MSEQERPLGEGQLIGRCYTRARRLPLVLGQWEGRRLWGGPYTVPQLVTMFVVLLGMVAAFPLWGHLGLLNAVPLVGVPYAASFAVRSLRVEGRSPFAVLAGLAALAAAPRQGRLGGQPLHAPRPVLLSGACTLTWCPAPAPTAGRGKRRAADVLAAPVPQPGGSRPATGAERPTGCPTPASAVPVPTGATPVRSGAAALLAARASERKRQS
ncbi:MULTISPECIES: hypothetical protein [Streptomyces]|uniref:hypothetical protein n=1 Tax=Streptomyces TaxID=1883 RepID=UPI00068DB12B|nr:hypothetical protein [Streptomyces sp. NRRL F-5053]